ncbi:hypothetical protein F5Y16DRAFT_230528 [Xylariaceae sp. FL0255]|nr:hypothetical protein F5Y16DRAFT_230528 [Xylariaceae sp. FL0255]
MDSISQVHGSSGVSGGGGGSGVDSRRISGGYRVDSASPPLPSNTTRITDSSASPGHHSPPPKQLDAHRQENNSSKLPAYRFADLNKESIGGFSSLLQHQHQQQQQQRHIPPSPVSLDPDQHPETTSSPPTTRARSPETAKLSNKSIVSPAVLDSLPPSSTTLSAPAHVKRTASLDFPNSTASANVKSPSESTETVVTVLQRRATDSASTQIADTADGGLPAAEASTREWAQGQRELLLPKTLQRSLTADDKRASLVRRPPLSYKPPTNTNGGSASIPPIRSFRSSGERRSSGLDMNVRSARASDSGDDYGDSNHIDRSLRALEGRRPDETMQLTPPDSAGPRADGDDNGDLFLRIAREDPFTRNPDGSKIYVDGSSAVARVARSARRPLSVAISSYRSPSPPRMSRRLSEQETTRPRGLSHEGERGGPPVSFRGHSREPQSDDLRHRNTTALRNSPLTPRTLAYQDLTSEPTSAHHRRRQPSVDVGSAVPSRMTSLKQASVNYSHPRAYNSSPLVPKSADPSKHDTPQNDQLQVEGTDSTASTAAPSTMWDELEELKSRIHRLELTGKLPSTSSAAISRNSDERPPTAHTNATTLSASPKRGASSVVQSTESPTVLKDKESHPLLHSALEKSKDFLPPEVYDALETATNDALALASMMGTAGQPGPISSGASNIGSNGGTTTVTDRQLRRKADSVCRSLTELCLALNENAGSVKRQQAAATPVEEPTITSPVVTQFSGAAAQRRTSVAASRALELSTSPRAVTRLEDKRASALPSPRYSSNIATASIDATAAAGRKTSLLTSRTRRAGTEEPEDGRRTSTLLMRSRRAGTEEPEDLSDRKPNLTRGRRATIDDGEDEGRFRTPSRATTEVNGFRPKEYISQLPPLPPKDADSLASSALPRRRLASTAINTRLAQPSVITTTASSTATPSRRYFDRAPTREAAQDLDRATEDRGQRLYSSLARTGSLNRRTANRQSMIAAPPSTVTNGYR